MNLKSVYGNQSDQDNIFKLKYTHCPRRQNTLPVMSLQSKDKFLVVKPINLILRKFSKVLLFMDINYLLVVVVWMFIIMFCLSSPLLKSPLILKEMKS